MLGSLLFSAGEKEIRYIERLPYCLGLIGDCLLWVKLMHSSSLKGAGGKSGSGDEGELGVRMRWLTWMTSD
jgi:hypothetical protein